MKLHCKIKFPINLLNQNLDPINLVTNITKEGMHVEKNYDYWLSKEFIEFFKDEFEFDPYLLFFKRNPNSRNIIHIDGTLDTRGDGVIQRWALNYTWNYENSVMNWYEPKNFGKCEVHNNFKLYHTRWSLDEVNLLESYCVNPITLVRTDIPHDVLNFDNNKIRYCLSIRSHPTKNKHKTFDEAYELFKKFLVED